MTARPAKNCPPQYSGRLVLAPGFHVFGFDVALATTAPAGSETVLVMVLRSLWPNGVRANRNNQIANTERTDQTSWGD